jgi:tRNA (guanine6-N2)-methyltransferase
MTGYLARTTRGVEWVVAAEVEGTLGAVVQHIGHREVLFTSECAMADVAALRTVDDVFVHVASIGGVERARASLDRLSAIKPAKVFEALDAVASARPLARHGAFDVSASALGKRNYNRFEVEAAIGRRLEAITGGQHLMRSRSEAPRATDVSWRVHIRDTTALVGLRIGREALHRRPYRRDTTAGSLHPPVAAVMVLVGGARTRQVAYDPFCGSATIVLEHAARVPDGLALGGDLDPGVLAVARANVERAAPSSAVLVRADAVLPPVRPGSVDVVLTNPPWDRQVIFAGGAAGSGAVWDELAATIGRPGRMVVLSEHLPDPPTGWASHELGWLAVAGSKPRLAVYAPHGTEVPPPADAVLAPWLRARWPMLPGGAVR